MMGVSGVTDLTRAREEAGWPTAEEYSIADRAEDDQPEQEELFVLEQGRRVSLSQLVGRNIPVEYRFNLNSKGLRGGGNMGLVAYSQPELLLVVPVRAGKVVVDPTYSEDGTVSKVRITANFRPVTAYDAGSREGRAALGLED